MFGGLFCTYYWIHFNSGDASFKIFVCDVTGHVIATVRARDADSGDNARISYKLDVSESEGAFSVDSETGQLSVTSDKLDIEQYHIYLTATDHGHPPRTTTALLNVIVTQHRLMTSRHGVMTSRVVGVSVYVTSAVCLGCLLLAVFLLFVVMTRRCGRHGNHQRQRCHDDERLATSSSHQHHKQQQDVGCSETAHILAKPPPLRHSVQVINRLISMCNTCKMSFYVSTASRLSDRDVEVLWSHRIGCSSLKIMSRFVVSVK